MGVRAVVFRLINYSLKLNYLSGSLKVSSCVQRTSNVNIKGSFRNLKQHWCKVVPTWEWRLFVKWGSSGCSRGGGWYLQTGLSEFKSVYREVRPSNIDLYSSAVFANEKLHTWDKHWPRFDSTVGYLISKAKIRGHGKTTLLVLFLLFAYC